MTLDSLYGQPRPIIQMIREGRPKRPNELQARERYQSQAQRFIELEFSYNSHMLLKRICEGGQKEPYMFGVPLYKIMLEVAKIMMMNELEILFLGSTLQEMRWQVSDPCLNEYVEEVADLTPRLQKDKQSRRVQLGLMLIAYIVKLYLNEDTAIFDFKIRDLIRTNFDKMYQVWVQKVQNNFKFNPKNMNRLFKDLDTNHKEKKQQIVDYNKLVSEFFRMNDGHAPPEEREEYERFPAQQPTKHEHLPVEEEEDIPENYRSNMRMMHNRVSQIVFNRVESGNQFLAPEYKNRKGVFDLQLVGKASLVEAESPNR